MSRDESQSNTIHRGGVSGTMSFPSPVKRVGGYYALRGFCYSPLAECRVNEWGMC